jgi:hypothetical protein
MNIIAHRGNLFGPNAQDENKISYLSDALKNGFDVEVDVRYFPRLNGYFAIHDSSAWIREEDNEAYRLEEDFLLDNRVFCHAKDPESLLYLREIGAHFFWHQDDQYTTTSKGLVWCLPGAKMIKDSICVLPERGFSGDISGCSAICTDYAFSFKRMLK